MWMLRDVPIGFAPIPNCFEEYMEQAFYGMFAFNSMRGLANRRLLDFLTSPEVGPLFREFVENVIDENWIDLARPEKAVFCY